MRFLSAFATRGSIQAILCICGLAFTSLFLPPLGLLSSAMVALVALRQGVKHAGLVVLASLLIAGLAGVAFANSAVSAIGFGLMQWLPVLPLAILLRETRRLDWALESAAALCVLAVVGVYGWIDDPSSLWREKLESFTSAMQQNASADIDAATMAKVVQVASRFMTGALAAGSVISLIGALLLARWQQAVLFNPGGFRREFIAIKIHPLLGYVGLACLLAGLLLNGVWSELGLNMTAVLGVLFTVVGLSILHAVLGGKGLWVAGIYVALLFMPQFLLPPLALLGLTDSWLDWRVYAKRISNA